MIPFAALCDALDGPPAPAAQRAALVAYLRAAPAADLPWALTLLTDGPRPVRVPPADLAAWALDALALPRWLLDDCVAHVGDTGEALALLIDTHRRDPPEGPPRSLHRWMTELVAPLKGADADARRAQVLAAWAALPLRPLVWINRILTTGLRLAVPRAVLAQALADVSALPAPEVAHRLTAFTAPTAAAVAALLAPLAPGLASCAPHPVSPLEPLAGPAEALGPCTDWQATWRWPGLPCQIIRRGADTCVWTDGADLVSDRCPALVAAARGLPDGTVLVGTLLVVEPSAASDPSGDRPPLTPQPHDVLTRRLARPRPSAAVRRRQPLVFVAHDLLADGAGPLTGQPLRARLARLAALSLPRDPPVAGGLWHPPALTAAGWPALEDLRQAPAARRTRGLRLRPLDGADPADPAYHWPLPALTVCAVLVYAHAGARRRQAPLTDYTFAVWHGDALVPVAKTAEGLSPADRAALDAWIHAHTLDRMGPVRTVPAERVFALSFAAVTASPRHKAGLVLQAPRVLAPRPALAPADAARLAALQAHLPSAAGP